MTLGWRKLELNGSIESLGSLSPKNAIGVSIPLASGAAYRGCKALVGAKRGELMYAFSPEVERSLSFEVNAYEISLDDERGMQQVSQVVRKLWRA